ncbi:dTDP-4-dehydrorhamnose 3,5-epimerase [soil metagenome]
MDGWTPGRIPGVMRRSIAFHPDDRGSFGELWRASWTTALGDPMRQANLSRSAARVLRGLHYHRRQADLWIVVDGHPFIALVDVRPALRGEDEPVVETMDAGPGDALYLPEGVAHGFYARDPVTLVYLVTSEYDGSDELGFTWDDPSAAVPWPDREPILSARDAEAPTLARLLEGLGA